MRTLSLSVLLVGCFAATPLLADWVTLHNGKHLRGIDLERQGDAYRFTLETGEVIRIPAGELFYVERSPRDETVEFRGESVSLRRKVETLQAERKARLEELVRNVEQWARAEEVARREFPGLRPEEKKPLVAGKPAGAGPVPASAVIDAITEPAGGEDPGVAPPGASDGESGEQPEAVVEGLAARERVIRADAGERADAFSATLAASDAPPARRLAARELGASPSSQVAATLARSAMADPYRSVRDACLRALLAAGIEGTGELFAPGLSSRDPAVRVRAANAISLFPTRAVLPDLFASVHMTWSGFGRGYTMQVTQRAYIADYELVSGGSGFAIVEVADPVVKTSIEGVALDVKVRRVELAARLRALRKITGQDFGTDIDAWREWWRNQEK